jgi:hypothetical protein
VSWATRKICGKYDIRRIPLNALNAPRLTSAKVILIPRSALPDSQSLHCAAFRDVIRSGDGVRVAPIAQSVDDGQAQAGVVTGFQKVAEVGLSN